MTAPLTDWLTMAHFSTLAIHAGYDSADCTNGDAAVPPIYLSAAFDMQSAAHGDALSAGAAEGFSYSRMANPTLDVLERRIAALEGGRSAVAFASGMTAVSAALLCAAEGGGRIIAARNQYGASVDAMDSLGGVADRAGHARDLRRVRREPVHRGRRCRRARQRRASAWHPAHHRQHGTHALPVPADRTGGRRRRAFDHEFEVDGGREQVARILDGTHVFTYVPNIGDARSLIVDPARITHREVSPEFRRMSGVDDNLIRLSIGLEDTADLIADLEQAIRRAY